MVVNDHLSVQGNMSNAAVLRTEMKNLVEPCFEEPPWTTGQLKVIAEPVTEAIQWLVAQLRHETDARKALESQLEANLAILRPCPESWIGDSDRIDKVEDSANLGGIVERLKRDLQRLQYEQVQQKKQQEEKAKVSEGLTKLRLDAISRDIQARAHQDELAKQIDALRLDIKTIGTSAGQNAAEAALANSVANLHSQLDGVCGALQAQLDSLQDRYEDLAKQMDLFGDEMADLRSARAFDPATSMAITPTSSSVSPGDTLEHAESSGANLETCKSSKSIDLAPEFVVPVWQDRQENGNPQVNMSEGMDKANLAQNVTGSRRPSACSTVGTIGGTDHRRGEVLSRDTDSSFGKPITPDGCMAWAEERIDELRAEMRELKKLLEHAQDVTVACNSHPNIHENNDHRTCRDDKSDNLQDQTRIAFAEKHKGDSSELMSDDFCGQLKDWLRQNLQELLEQIDTRSTSKQPVSSQSVDAVPFESHQLDGVCELVLGDVGGSLTSEANAAYERWSATREEVISGLKDEMNNWLEEQQHLILQEIRDNFVEKHHPIAPGNPTLSNSNSDILATSSTVEELEGIGLAKGGHANIGLGNANSDIFATLSAIKERLQALEITGVTKGRHADITIAADLVAAKEGLRRLDQRIEALEHDKLNVGLPSETDSAKKMARRSTGDVNPKRSVEEVNWDGADVRREIANISQAVKGTQRSLDLAKSKIEDLSSAQKILKTQVDASLPHVVQALQTLAQQVGLDMSKSSHFSRDQPNIIGSSDAETSQKTQGSLNMTSLHELLNSNNVPNLFVSPDMLSQAVNALGSDLHTSLNRLQRDMKDVIKSKADSQEIQKLAMKLEDMEQGLPAYLMQFTQVEEEGVENPAGVRWPLQPARCISCNAKADLVAPWGHKVVPKFPWPQRQQWPNSKANSNRAVQSSPPPSRGRRRETSLPSIDRDASNSKYH